MDSVLFFVHHSYFFKCLNWVRINVWRQIECSFACKNTCEDTHMTAPTTVKLLAVFFCWVTPENAVGMTAGREWERDYGETKTTREGMREAQKEWEMRDNKEREREVREPADVKVPPITSCFSSTPSLCLFHPFFHSHWHSSLERLAPLWRSVLISDNGDASVGAHASVRASSRCQHELKLKLRCTCTQSETQTDTVTHSRGLWAKAPRKA